MRIVFSGLEGPLQILPGTVSVLEVANKTLYSRLCKSLLSGKGENAIEPYSIWDEAGDEVPPSSALLPVFNIFDLPWSDRVLEARLYDAFERALLEDEESRMTIESLARDLNSCVFRLGLPAQGDYAFGIEWEFRKYLKAFKFGYEKLPEDSSLLDSLIRFFDYVCDVGVHRPILFVGLKSFLDENDLEELYENVFVRDLSVVVLEGTHDNREYENEIKIMIDQDFIEF